MESPLADVSFSFVSTAYIKGGRRLAVSRPQCSTPDAMRPPSLLLVAVFSLCFWVVGSSFDSLFESEESSDFEDEKISVQISESSQLVSKLDFDADAIIKKATEALANDWKLVLDLVKRLNRAIRGFNASMSKFDHRLTKQDLLIEGVNDAFPTVTNSYLFSYTNETKRVN